MPILSGRAVPWRDRLSEAVSDVAQRLREAADDFNGNPGLYEAAIEEIERLNREIRYLRHYGNKDCTHMADRAMADGAMDEK